MGTIKRIEAMLKNAYSGPEWDWNDLTANEEKGLELWIDQLRNGQRVKYDPETDSFILPPNGQKFRRVMLERLVKRYFPKEDIQF